MAGAGGGEADFTNWLNNKLRELNTDETVFGSYITGILEGDETNDEKTEALEGILEEIIEENLETIIKEILDRWNMCRPREESAKKPVLEDVDAQLARILETQKLQTVVQRQYTADELRIREQILSQYSQTEVSEEEDDDGEGDEQSGPSLEKNTNVQDVQQLQKERREQARVESRQKKDKDKEDREKQKQMREEKKEKRKTVKGERRR